jgi:formamidopyrimidine-DNA glycosylase
MPELAEVEYYRKQWLPGERMRVRAVYLNAGKRIFRGVNTSKLANNLTGQRLESSSTHGKQMCFRFSQSHWLGVHLGMTGTMHAREASATPAKHDHLILVMEEGPQLVFSDPRMFGRILYSDTSGTPEWWSDLPPEILSDSFTLEHMAAFFKRRCKSPIKAVLLIQDFFPGVGNWMADEILWRARIHPATHAGRIGPSKQVVLYESVLEVCRGALRIIGENWSTPPDHWLFNHRWKGGGVCPKTGAPLSRAKIGGRTTCWSSKWQNYRGV